jgi:uncharacterized membrane protein YeaQ/YmgE (transglycosylase-associated protein family)
MIGSLLLLALIGLIAGVIARIVVPGSNRMGIVATMVLGIVGSFIGGFLGYVLLDADVDEGALQTSGIVGSIVGAVIALLIYRALVRPRFGILPRRRLLGRRGILR